MFLSCGVRSSGSTRRFFLTSYPGDAYGLNAHRFAFRVRPGYAARRSYVSRDVPPRRAWFECDPGESRCARPDHVSWFARDAGEPQPVENLNVFLFASVSIRAGRPHPPTAHVVLKLLILPSPTPCSWSARASFSPPTLADYGDTQARRWGCEPARLLKEVGSRRARERP